MNTLYHILILSTVVIAAVSVSLLPFLLIAGLMRVFLPRVKVWRLSLLSVLLTLFVYAQIPFFRNLVGIDKIVEQSLSGLRSFENGFGAELGLTAKGIVLVPLFTAGFMGLILIPLLMARAGLAIVDRTRRLERPNKMRDDTAHKLADHQH